MNYQVNYQDFQILVNENKKIRASSEQGEVRGELRLDMDRTKHTLKLINHQIKDGNLIKGLGDELYQALFPDQINARFQAAIAGAQTNNHGVRLRLIFESPQLAALPWEFLYDKQTNTFLGNNTQTALSRYIDVPLQRWDIKSASLPLRVLLVISSPNNLARLDVAGEEELIRSALGQHIEAGQIELDVLKKATTRNIRQKLREKPYNVFHFIGHGEFNIDRGYICLVDEYNEAQLLDDENFANFFLSARNLGLVILNSCQGATVSVNQVFAGTAPNLVRRGIPAVVAMQYSILDSTAKLFADEFYRTLTLNYPVDAAIQTTRNAISQDVGLDRRDFGTPVLYMRAKNGIILDVAKKLSDLQSTIHSPSQSGRVPGDDLSDDLSSDQGVDYSRLKGLLKAGAWKQADDETVAVMLQAANRTEEEGLDDNSIKNFPCTDLQTIDQLWVNYSNERFGFSVQKVIWKNIGGNPDAPYEIWLKFGNRVGWCVGKEWINLDVSHNVSSNNGHFPIMRSMPGCRWSFLRTLFSRPNL